MKLAPRPYLLLAALALILFDAGCQPEAAPNPIRPAGQSVEAAAGSLASVPTVTPAAPLPAPVEVLLPDPSIGLESLTNYRLVLTTEVKGNLDGQPYQRQTRIEYLHSEAGNEEVKLHIIGSGEVPFNRHLILHSGAIYTIDETGETCEGQAQGQETADVFTRPDRFLMPVLHSEPDGSETVNELPVRHYRLDAGSMPLAAASGEMWLAQDGGQLVRYHLDVPAPAQPTGKGLEASQGWQYDLTLTGEQEAVLLPPICQPVLMEIPVPADAEEIQRMGGLTRLHTRAAAGEVFAFYRQKLAELGWQMMDASLPDPLLLPHPVNAEKDQQWLTIWLDEGESGGLDVDISMTDLGAAAVLADSAAQPTPASPDTDTAGLPEDIPLYPGAYNLKKLTSGALVFFTTDKLETVTAYYAEQMNALGWETLRAQVIANGKTVTWVKEKRQMMCTATRQDGAVQVMMVQISPR